MNRRTILALGIALVIANASAIRLAEADPPPSPAPSAGPLATPAPVATAAPIATPMPSPTPTMTPSPPVAPPDAAGIAATTPPLGIVTAAPAPTVPATLWLAPGDTTTVDIATHGGHPYVPVVVDGVRREFLLSTTESTAIDDSLSVAPQAGAGSLGTLQVGDVRLTGVSVARARISPYSSTYLGYPADGIIGAELFAHYPVTIDAVAGKLTIYRDEAAALKARPTGATVLPLEIVGGSPAVDCSVDGHSASPCVVDLNSDGDVMLDWNSEQAQRLLRFGPTLSCMREAEPGREMFGRIARGQSLALGSINVSAPLLRLPSPASNPAPNPLGWRTSLGNGIFERFVTTIDEGGGALVLGAGAGAPLPSPTFDRSGMWLIWRSGSVVVRNVMAGSPAASAGIEAGDAIVDVSGKPAIDLDAVRAALAGDVGTRVAVVYERARRQAQATLTLRDLL